MKDTILTEEIVIRLERIQKEKCSTCFYWLEYDKCIHKLRKRVQTMNGNACMLWEDNLDNASIY